MKLLKQLKLQNCKQMKTLLISFIAILFAANAFSQTHDLELIRINIPRDNAKTGMPLQPSIYIYNNGNSTENEYSIEVIIKNSEDVEVYNSTEFFTNANFTSGSYKRPLFYERWIPEEDGTYEVTATVICEGDENQGNDQLQSNIVSEDLIVGFGWNAFDNIQPYGPAMLYINSTDACEIQSITQWGNSDTFMAGADFIENEWYAVQYSYDNSSRIFTINPLSGEASLKCEAGVAFDGMAYDITTETVFANKSNSIYILDVETGVSELLGTVSAAAGFVGLACDKSGNLFALEGYTGNCGLYSINKTTGEGTLIGLTSVSIMTAQDIAYDRNNDVLYGMLAGNQYNGLYNINTTTGLATQIEPYGNEISGSAIPYIPLLVKQEPYLHETDVFTDANVWAMFHDQLTEVDLSGISIIDELGNPVQNVYASIIGSTLHIEHDDFASETVYTVTIPAGSVSIGNFDNNAEIWTFTTGFWTSINNLNNDEIIIFPNPTSDYINVNCHSDGKYSIVTLNGKQLATGNLSKSNNTIFIKDLSAGIYVLQIKVNEEIINNKILKK